MKDLLVILASSSSFLHPTNRRHHHSTPFPKSRPSKKITPNPNPNPNPPLLLTVRWDLSTASLRDSPVNYYANLASKLAAAGRFRHFLLVAESVVASGVEPSWFAGLLSDELVSAGVARLLGREGEVWSFVEVLRGLDELGFGAMKVLDGVSQETVAKEVARECRRVLECGGGVEEAVELMEALSGFHFPIRDLVEPSEIVGLCVRKRDPDLAVRYACIHPHARIVFCTIIHEFGKKGDMISALTVFEASKQKLSGPNMYAYRTIIDVCGLCGDYLKSRSIYEELLAEKVTPNIYVFNSLMNVNACDLSYTVHVYKHMQTLGVTGDMTSYNILLKSCCLAARVDLAQDIYREVKHLESTGVLKLDVFTYSTIIKVFADAKLWRMALKIKGDMLSAGFTPNMVIWSSLISACANAGLVEQAIQLFNDMLLAGCVPNTQCCNVLLYACAEGRQYDKAFRLFRSWKESGFDVNVCSKAGVEHARRKSSRTVSDSTSESHNLNNSRKVPFIPTTATYNILMKACGTNYLRAKALIDEMNAVGLSPNYISWTTLINVCGGSGSVEAAVQILSSMREAAGQPDVIAYTTAIKVCVERKFLNTAFILFEEMKRNQVRPNLVTYKTLLRARSRYGSLQEVQQCLEIYQDMRKAGQVLQYKPNDYYLKQLIEEWCEGIIQNGNQIESNLGGPYSLLLEKVATHLEKRNSESVAIDLQGLSKVEARIVVLAVLRMIKENYAQGCPLKDDLFIIVGVKNAYMTNVKDESKVEDAIIKLLRNEFGLEVILGGPKQVYLGASFDSCANEQGIVGSERLPTELQFSPRRPAVLQRLKVTRKSLLCWLQKTSKVLIRR